MKPCSETLPMGMLDETRYTGGTVEHVHEHRQAEQGGSCSYTWTKNRLHVAGQVSRAPRRGAHRKKHRISPCPRDPPPKMDRHIRRCRSVGGIYRWNLMEHATGEFSSAFFVEEEGTMSHSMD